MIGYGAYQRNVNNIFIYLVNNQFKFHDHNQDMKLVLSMDRDFPVFQKQLKIWLMATGLLLGKGL